MPEQYEGVNSMLAFPLVIKINFSIENKCKYFRKNIQARTILKYLKQPVMKNKYYKKHKRSETISNDVMKNGILIGCHQGMKKNELQYICEIFLKFLKQCR